MLRKTEDRRRREQQRIRWLESISDSVHMSLRNLWEIAKDREAWHAEFMGSQRLGHNLETEQACTLLRRGKLTERQYGVVLKSV